MATQFIAILAAAGLATAGMAVASETRSAGALPELTTEFMQEGTGGGQKCRVEVLRTGAGGTAAVTRSTGAGGCVCTVTTGPAGSNGAAEDVVAALLRDRECEGAPNAGDEGAGGGSNGAVIAGIVGAVAIGGLAIGLGSDSSG